MGAELTRWQGSEPPDVGALGEALQREPHAFSYWSNGPGDTYAPHTHSYDKLLICLRGSISFTLPATGQRLELAAGDRLALSAQTPHSAVVGAAGVECAEAHVRR
ncbi:MAG TPA: hypothetical protein VID72_13135 [Ktedonobacterales bacterium]|jgi:quercetin dioxygenase-like cupin family protein